MICNELVELSRGALVLQLQQCVLLDVGSAAENAIEEGSNRREHVDADSHIYDPYVPWCNHDSSKKDPERDFNRHHRDEVSSFAHDDPLLQSALSSHVLITLTFVSFSSPSRLVTCVPPPLSAMYSDDAENTVNIIYTLVSQGHAIGLIGWPYAGQNHSRIVPAKAGDYPSTGPYAKQNEEPGQCQKHDRYPFRLFSCSRDFIEVVYHFQGKVERKDEPRAVSESVVPDD